MPARLDDMLRQMPAQAMPVGLPAQIRLRLKAQRAREGRLRLGLDASMAALLISGLIVLGPQLAGAGTSLPGGSVERSMAWVNELGSAPAMAVWGTLTGAIDWTRGLAGSFGIAGLLGLILVALPMFVWLRRVMPEAGLAPPLDGRWSGPMQEEGAGA